MPLTTVLAGYPGFGPDEVKAMACAFEQACATLQPSSDQSSLRELIAIKIVANAQCGERDPSRLSQLVVSEIKTGRGASIK